MNSAFFLYYESNYDKTVFSHKEVINARENILRYGKSKKFDDDFWNDSLYYFTKIYDSFSPFMRLCVDLRIEGKQSKEIAYLTSKKVETVYKTIFRAKKRYVKAFKIC